MRRFSIFQKITKNKEAGSRVNKTGGGASSSKG